MVFAGYVIWNSSVPRCCSCFYDVAGITLWPFVFVRDPEPAELRKVVAAPFTEHTSDRHGRTIYIVMER